MSMFISQKGFSKQVALESTTRYQPYEDASYTYHCMATPGNALSDEAWQIMRQASDGGTAFAGGTAEYIHAATDLTTVQAYSYS